MNFNTFLLRFGLSPDNFVNKLVEPIKTPTGFIYEVEQTVEGHKCPYCGGKKYVQYGTRWSEINCSETDLIQDTLRVLKHRFLCKSCHRTFTPVIYGIDRYSQTSSQVIDMIVKDFYKPVTFSQIADRYGLTRNRIIQIFDEKIRFVPRRTMPMVMCIDEIAFRGEDEQSYCCILYDFEQKDVVDMIKNRQLPYLDEYFSAIKEAERNNVRYFISDMYDGYRTVRNKYFKKAIHIIDLFHVVAQLTRAVNIIRTQAMKKLPEGSLYHNFMKSHWRCFLCRNEDIPDKFYTPKKSGVSYHYDDMVFECIKTNKDLLEAYSCLQDLYHYNRKQTFMEAIAFVDFLSKRLLSYDNDNLNSVGKTYSKWRIEIANGMARNQNHSRYTNGVAESINNLLKTIVKVSYGYHNFERFRKRVMLILTYRKDPANRRNLINL